MGTWTSLSRTFGFVIVASVWTGTPAVAILLHSAHWSHATPHERGPETVEGKGRGSTLQAAREEAVLAAMRRLAGDRLKKEGDEARRYLLALALTRYVTVETIGTPKFAPGGMMEVTVRVTMDIADLDRGPSDEEPSTPAPAAAPSSPSPQSPPARESKPARTAGDLGSRIADAKGNYEATKALLADVFAGLPDSIMTLRVVDSDGKTTTTADPRLIEVDRATGKATLTVPVIIGFDLQEWEDRTRPMLEQVLQGLAESVVVDGAIVDRSTGSHQQVESVPFSKARTIPNPSIRDIQSLQRTVATAKGREFVALLRENLGRGRQLNFDLYEFEEGLIPFLRPIPNRGPLLEFPPRTLRVRLLDSDGGAFDGQDLLLSRNIQSSGVQAFGVTMLNGVMRPFVEQQQFSGAPSRLVQIAPMWIPRGGFLQSMLASPEAVIEVKFTMSQSEAAEVSKVRVELLSPN